MSTKNSSKKHEDKALSQIVVSGSCSFAFELMKKYHNIGIELRNRKKSLTDFTDLQIIDLQISTNESFEKDIMKLVSLCHYH
jgi:hypothetical protein